MKPWEAAVQFGSVGLAFGMVGTMFYVDHLQKKANKKQAEMLRKAPVTGDTVGRSLAEMVGISAHKVKHVSLTCEPGSMAELTVVMYTDWTVKEGIEEQVKKYVLQEKF